MRAAGRMGIELSVAAFPAGSDMSPLVRLHGIPTCIASAADLTANGIHGDDERISVKELTESVKLYASLMLGLGHESRL
jgi:acetylornithine deacetylase/succinyl-diaminopimelate desuccinylase-like protein